MKKYFFIALLSALVLLTGCKKTAFKYSNNFFAKQLKVAESIIGTNQTKAESILKKNGWTYSESLSQVSEGALAYTSQNNLGIVYVNYQVLYDKEMDFGDAFAVYYYFYDGFASELKDENAFRDFINLLGEKPTIKKIQFSFDGYDYIKGDGDNYYEFVGNFTNIYKTQMWSATWWADDNSENARCFQLSKEDNLTTIGLVIGID